jgi:chromosome segregation ATPase
LEHFATGPPTLSSEAGERPEVPRRIAKEIGMTLVQRGLTLAKADAHGVLDSLEDSALVLRQCLRDAELELTQKRQRREELERWQEQLDHARRDLASRVQELDADIHLALGQDQEDLARFSIRRLLAARQRESALAEQLAAARDEGERLALELETQERELTELRERVQTHLTEERARQQFGAAEPGREGRACVETEAPVHDLEVELELLRRRSERSGEPTS